MFRTRTLDRYIFREMMPPFFLSMAVLLLVLFLEKMIKLADLVITKGVTLVSIGKVLAFVVPGFLVITIPMSLIVASLTAFSRMSSDSEITAMKASRISLYRMIRPVFLFALFAFFITAFTSLVLVPRANAALKAHLFDMVKSRAMVGIEPGIFSNTFDGMVVYVDKMGSLDNLEGVFIFDERSAKEPYAIVGKQGRLIADPQSLKVTLAIQDGSINPPTSADQSYSLMRFKTARLYLDINNTLVKRGAPDRGFEDMDSSELMQVISKGRKEGTPTYTQETEFQKRLSIPFACVILGLIGAPLGIRKARSGKSSGIAIAVLVFLVYYMILGTAANLANTGTIRPLKAFWIPNYLMLIASIVFVYKRGQELDFRIWSTISTVFYRIYDRLHAVISRKDRSRPT